MAGVRLGCGSGGLHKGVAGWNLHRAHDERLERTQRHQPIAGAVVQRVQGQGLVVGVPRDACLPALRHEQQVTQHLRCHQLLRRRSIHRDARGVVRLELAKVEGPRVGDDVRGGEELRQDALGVDAYLPPLLLRVLLRLLRNEERVLQLLRLVRARVKGER